jgi:hypothetical protein
MRRCELAIASLGQLARKQHPVRAVPWFFVISVLNA